MYLDKLHHYLSGGSSNTNSEVDHGMHINSLTVFLSHYQQIRDVSSFINILVFCFMVYRKFFARH